MYLKKLHIVNFKNYKEKKFEFSPKINCFVGNNGTGKTNLLDAIYYLSFCKSYFNAIDTENINHDDDYFLIQGEFIKDEVIENIYCGVKKNERKQFKRNDKEYSRLADHIGLINSVMISPIDKILIIGGSEERRKFLNNVIAQFDKAYLEDVINYNKALLNRNKVLKNFAKTDTFNEETIEIWDEQLIPSGTRIYEKRKDFINKFLPIFNKHYENISLKNEIVGLDYESDLSRNDLRELLKSSIEKDRILQYTTKGIHKDDLVFTLSEFPIKRIGSQGQQKTYLITLKLAQFEFLSQISQHKPIFLLDDIFDKLDAERVKQIVKLVADDNFGQIFITDTNQNRLEQILKDIPIKYKLFQINKE
ncbi:MAG: DNA replication/repair protein RecF [Bacteroidales bacterium]|nr:DNA replication/repair protein RecF [Bacteroidales bacterium]